MDNRQLRFYEHDRLASFEVAGTSMRVMNTGGIPVCQLEGASYTETNLIAIDKANSVLASIHSSAVKRATYCAYGNSPIGSLPAALGYNGEYLEAFGVYLLGRGERGYSPRLRRFISADRASIFLAGNLNAYAYTAGDPINYNDPSGNFRGPIARYKDWKAGRALAKASKDLTNRIDSTENLKFNIDNEKRKDAQRARDIKTNNTNLDKTEAEMLALISSMSGMDSTMTYESSKHGLKASYLYAGYAEKAAQLRNLESTFEALNIERSKLEKAASQVSHATLKFKNNEIAIHAARSRLKYLENKYPHVASKAIRNIT